MKWAGVVRSAIPGPGDRLDIAGAAHKRAHAGFVGESRHYLRGADRVAGQALAEGCARLAQLKSFQQH